MNTSTTLIAAPSHYQTMLENYASLVAKTNTELSFWLSMGNWMTTILGVFVAVIAVFVAYAIWKNSDEQKKRFKDFLDSQEAIIKKNLEEFEILSKKGRQEAEQKLEVLIAEQQKELRSATTDNKQEIQKAINDLKREKATIGAHVVPTYPISGNLSGGVGYVGTMRMGAGGGGGSLAYGCPACGYRSPFYSKFCPMCGNKGD